MYLKHYYSVLYTSGMHAAGQLTSVFFPFAHGAYKISLVRLPALEAGKKWAGARALIQYSRRKIRVPGALVVLTTLVFVYSLCGSFAWMSAVTPAVAMPCIPLFVMVEFGEGLAPCALVLAIFVVVTVIFNAALMLAMTGVALATSGSMIGSLWVCRLAIIHFEIGVFGGMVDRSSVS